MKHSSTILIVDDDSGARDTLEALLASRHELLGVVTQPHRPKGRGQKRIPTPVKSIALRAHLPVYQPEKIRDPAFLKILQSLRPDLMVVVAYGQILSAAVLARLRRAGLPRRPVRAGRPEGPLRLGPADRPDAAGPGASRDRPCPCRLDGRPDGGGLVE